MCIEEDWKLPVMHETQWRKKRMNHQENVIEIKHLNKSYGEVQAVKDLSFRVKNEESCLHF